MQGFAEQYNTDFPANRMDLVLFDDALRHLITVSRILGMPRGNMLFVGVGGSGKQSLTRLASYIAGNFTFQITITKAYNLNSFMDDMRWVGRGTETSAACSVFASASIRPSDGFRFLAFLNKHQPMSERERFLLGRLAESFSVCCRIATVLSLRSPALSPVDGVD